MMLFDAVPLIRKIDDRELRMFVIDVLTRNSKYFEIPSSRTGKYHPRDEWKKGGQWLHTKRAFRIMEHLLTSEKKVGPKTRDALLAAVLIHDVNKAIDPRDEASGPEHLLTYEQYRDCWFFYPVIELVAIHAGKWTPDPMQVGDINFIYNPKKKMHHYMHLADYLASRNDIKVDVSRPKDTPNRRTWFGRWLARRRGWME